MSYGQLGLFLNGMFLFVAGILASRMNSTAAVALSAAGLGSIGLAALFSLNFSLVLLFATFLFVDPIRKVVGAESETWSFVGLLAIDGALVIAFLAFYARKAPWLGRQTLALSSPQLPGNVKKAMIIYVCWVVLELLNPYYPSLLLGIAAVREYLLPIPAFAIGMFVAIQWQRQQWRRLFYIVGAGTAAAVIVSIVQFAVDADHFSDVQQSLLNPAEHAVHTWEDTEVELVSSLFASSKRYARFLLLTYPLLWASLSLWGKPKYKTVLTVVFLTGMFTSGSREGIVLLLVTDFIFERWKAITLRVVPPLVALALLIPALSSSDLSERVRFSMSTGEDWVGRARYISLIPLFETRADVGIGIWLFGIGAGHSGQPTQLLSAEGRPSSFLESDLDSLEGTDDTGFYKILTDLGLIGVAAFLFLQFSLLRIAWPFLRRRLDDPFGTAAAAALIVWLVVFSKSHSIQSDIMAHSFLWFYSGMIIARHQYLVSKTVPHTPRQPVQAVIAPAEIGPAVIAGAR